MLGKSDGPKNHEIIKETIHAAAENTSLINPLKNPVIPKAVNNKRDSQSIKTKSSVIGNYLR